MTRFRKWALVSAWAIFVVSSVPMAQETPTSAGDAAPAHTEESTAERHRGPDIGFRHGGRGDEFAMFRDVRIPEGEVHRGDLVCLFCDLEISGEVEGEVVVVFGTLRINGAIGNDTVAVLSNVVFGEHATIDGDFVDVLGSLTGEGQISGDRVHIPLAFVPPSLGAPFGVLGTLLTWGAVVWTSLLFLLLVILTAVAPGRVRTVADSAPASLFLAYLAGLGAYVAVSLVNFALVATVLGIPLAGLVWVLFLIAKWIGLAGIYLWIGRSIGRLFGRELSILSAVLLGFFPFMLVQLIPVFFGGFGFLLALGVRLLFWLFLEIPAVGLSVLTRGGGRLRDR